MPNYHIYKNPHGATEAVKQGWSWPAFFFSWIWAFSKGLNTIAMAILVGMFAIIILIPGADSEKAFIGVGGMLVSLWLGAEGNEWKEKDLWKKGYKQIKTIFAETPEGAIASLTKSSLKDSPESQDTNETSEYCCTDCGSPCIPNAKYCSNCGAKFN
jgi:hypothetical protein